MDRVARERRRELVVLVDGCEVGVTRDIGEQHVVGPLGHILRPAVEGDAAQVVQGALAGHAATGRDALADLIDADGILIEGQVFLGAFDHVVAGHDTAAQLHGKVEADFVARIFFQLGLALDDVVFASADELGPVGQLVGFDSQRRGPAFDGLRAVHAHRSLGHSMSPWSRLS